MDPYLERASLWPDVHNRLIVALADALAPQVRPRYYVAIEERTYTVAPGDLVLAGRADVAVIQTEPAPPDGQPLPAGGAVAVEIELPDLIRETYLEVRTAGDDRIITLAEILSPTNKRPGEGREQYLRKRTSVLGSLTHLVEIDLLRAGEPMPILRWSGRSDYRILVSRGEQRPRAHLLPFSVRQPIPGFSLPLQPGDEEPEVDLNGLLHALYDRAGFDLRIDYRGDPEPPLAGTDAEWSGSLLREVGVRT
jgi:hypothetical protein